LKVALSRIDDRLIHGQVVYGWMPKIDANLIVVADAALVDDTAQQTIYELALPTGMEARFVHPRNLKAYLHHEQRPAVVLFRTPLAALEAYQEGFACPRINLGNLHFEPGKRSLRKTFCCNRQELSALRKLAENDIILEYQPAPDTKRVQLDPTELNDA